MTHHPYMQSMFADFKLHVRFGQVTAHIMQVLLPTRLITSISLLTHYLQLSAMSI